VKREIEIEAKYEGYIKRQEEAVARQRQLEGKRVPTDMVYDEVAGLSRELKAKLSHVKPETLGQAYRIPGMTPGALTALMVAMKKREERKRTERGGAM